MTYDEDTTKRLVGITPPEGISECRVVTKIAMYVACIQFQSQDVCLYAHYNIILNAYLFTTLLIIHK